MAERGSFGGSLYLAFVDEPVHVAEERLEALSRLMDVHDPRVLVARVPNRMRHPGGDGRCLADVDGAPLAVHENLERALDHPVGLLGGRMHVHGRSGHSRLDPVGGFEQLAGGVFGRARDLPPHPHPGAEIQPAMVAS